MRVLMGLDKLDPRRRPAYPESLTNQDLEELYQVPTTPWLRVNMVSTVDGSATGGSGLTGSINNEADKRVFHLLRRMADAIVVGAGTARAEGYRPTDRPIVLVSRRADVPARLRDAEPGAVLMATTAHAERLDEARTLLGNDNVLVLGSHRVDLVELKRRLAERGWSHLLSEGGPHLLHDLVAQGVADELDTTFVPRLVSGQHPRITDGPDLDVPLDLRLLIEADGTLIGRWLVTKPAR